MTPSPEDWAQALDLLGQALDRPEAEREAWLAALPADAARLKPMLAKLLRDRTQLVAGDFMQSGASAPQALLDEFRAGQLIGPYRLLRQLGAGGMADVWLAERADGAHRRQVALKLPLSGRLGQLRIAVGFVQECHVLSRLTHPNIASVLDAGSDTQGDAPQPWLAMEFIDGQPITRHCHDAGLGLAARLRLFLQVLQAVQHAHTQLVIHRDIKPANVLVDRDGQVKLLDFGVAKLLAEAADTADLGAAKDAPPSSPQTLWGGRAMTPEYASPEQIAGSGVGTASDVFSLGALLFELLLGRRLHSANPASPGALEQAILHTEAPRASEVARSDPAAHLPGIAAKRLARQLAGDLDLIIAKALRKPPEQRYATAAAFADDIERHLQQRPILARPDSISHQLRRFAARNRVMVGAAGLVVLVLAGGIVSSLWQARLARLEGERAKAAMSFLTGLFENGARQGSGQRPAFEITGKELLEAGIQRLNTEYREPTPLRLELLQLLGKVSEEMDLQDLSTPLLDEALALSKMLFGEHHPRHAEALLHKAEATVRHGQYAQAVAQGRLALDALVRLRPPPTEALAQAHILLGNALDQTKAHEASQSHLQTAIKLLQDAHSTSENRSRAPFYLARAFEARGDLAGAEALYLDGLAAARRNFGPRSYILAFGEENYGDLLRQMARFDDARQHLAQALEVYTAVLGPRHLNVASARYYLGQVMAVQGQRVQADALYVQAIALSDELVGPFHPSAGSLFSVDRAQLLLDMGRLAPARALYEAWLRHWPAGSEERARLIRFVGLGYSRLLIAQHDLPAAEAVLAEVDTSLRQMAAGPRQQAQRSQWQARRAQWRLAAGDAAAARALLNTALQAPGGDFASRLALLAVLAETQPAAPAAQAALDAFATLGDTGAWAAANVERQALLEHTLGRLTLQAGRPDAAKPRLARALALRERIDAPDSPWLAQARRSLAECAAASGRQAAAPHGAR
ncbi:protein kinase domain-containing protein [Aquabacterium sp.]|uniref:protein kinase domain-containing protein n=1 Tax=Aquabacterium sp. TaxID=1872578 RepID=UPI002D0C4665|nr:tetratricopeptide repeat protein [Aquabacterium sp.]HSW03594.1 tetratricopeptide repeat protein [Aquabacterium sp.]